MYSVHFNPIVRGPVEQVLGGAPIYLSLVHLMKCSTVILTEPDGIQAEAPCLCIPVLAMRDTTERGSRPAW